MKKRINLRHRRRGSMLTLTIAVIVFVVLPLAYFSLEFSRMLGAHQQERSAIEAGAAAAATDLSRIVIEDPNFGFVSLSDQAPVGKATIAGDNYYLPVRSINTLLATTRLDMIIADQLNSTVMRKCADLDYQHCMVAKDSLVAELNKCIQPGGQGRDMDGNVVMPNDDALKAYNSNLIRMTGGVAEVIPASFKLTLGGESGLSTVTQLPQPLNIASVPSSARNDSYYKACINIPYKSRDFVFAATDNQVRLLDYKLFQGAMEGLPYLIPSVVKCEADQKFTTKDQYGKQHVRIVHAVACAQCSSLGDHRPAPGAFLVDFSTGSLKGLNNLTDILSSAQIMKSPTDLLYTCNEGDSPPSPLVEIIPPAATDAHPSFGMILTIGIYDWIRAQGSTLDVGSLVDALTVPFLTSNLAHEEWFQADAQGVVQHKSILIPPELIKPISHKQLYSRSGIALIPGGIPKGLVDVYVKDYVFRPGRITGGIHAGQPVELGNGPAAGPPPGLERQIDETYKTSAFSVGPVGGANRPTYFKDGVALNLLFDPRATSVVFP
ncbi:MAG: hypothetical protein JST44_15415 [Cyanobacteria bacterium SZAS LIN-5]|nr:hypothetical protein [Cyanobacteria bacterium SZAS LIN-5]RTL34485.1 MAG: hypothetical protein EKK48_31375 [Candidatus Melainabacteria bacterium]